MHCFTLAEYREARDRLRIAGARYLGSDDPELRILGQRIQRMVVLSERFAVLFPDLFGGQWAEEMNRRFGQQAPVTSTNDEPSLSSTAVALVASLPDQYEADRRPARSSRQAARRDLSRPSRRSAQGHGGGGVAPSRR